MVTFASWDEARTVFPIAFSVVREDSCQDVEIIAKYLETSETDSLAMTMIASGGETLALLACRFPKAIFIAVDPNLSQLSVCKIKMDLLLSSPNDRLMILGYEAMSSADRLPATLAIMSRLGIAPETFGDIDLVGQRGIDYVGRYEILFDSLRSKLFEQRENVKRLFACESVADQIALVQPTAPLGAALDAAFDSVFSLENLIIYFGENATGNRVQEFSDHFTSRIRQYLSLHLASRSAWMFNLLCGADKEIMPNFPQFPWLSLPPTEVSASISYRLEMMKPVLDSLPEESQYVVHLSNILDWDSHEEATGLLASACRVLKPKGVVIIRQLNSDLDIPSLGPGFRWDLEFGRELEVNDRSFFYRNIFVGIKS